MEQASFILPLLAALQGGPDLRLEQRPWVDLAGEACDRRTVLSITNEGKSEAWAVSVRAGHPKAEPLVEQRLSGPLRAGNSLLLLLCLPPSTRSPYCVDVGVLRRGDRDPSDTNPANNRWCWHAGSTASPHAGTLGNPSGENP